MIYEMLISLSITVIDSTLISILLHHHYITVVYSISQKKTHIIWTAEFHKHPCQQQPTVMKNAGIWWIHSQRFFIFSWEHGHRNR